jgi:hypothetical protein
MSTAAMHSYALALSEEERDVLTDLLEQALKTTEIEEHRADALHAKEVLRARERTIESLLQKARAARPT